MAAEIKIEKADTVAFIKKGREIKVDRGDITAEQWVEIIRWAVDMLPLDHLHGFIPIKEILEFRTSDNTRVNRHVLECPVEPSQTVSKKVGLLNRGRFLSCAKIGYEQFPPLGNIKSEELWQMAPKTETEDGQVIFIPIVTGNILLSKMGRLYYLKTTWDPREKRDARSPGILKRLRYETNPARIRLTGLDDKGLARCFASRTTIPEGIEGKVILYNLAFALEQTAGKVLCQYNKIVELRQVMEDSANRIE